MGAACSLRGREMNREFEGKSEGKRPIGIPNFR
jgi:hypothetical protein